MIMQWKKDGAVYTTAWQDLKFTLFEGEDKRWHLKASGKNVRQSWPTSRLAMESIDSAQQKVVRAQMQPTPGKAVSRGL